MPGRRVCSPHSSQVTKRNQVWLGKILTTRSTSPLLHNHQLHQHENAVRGCFSAPGAPWLPCRSPRHSADCPSLHTPPFENELTAVNRSKRLEKMVEWTPVMESEKMIEPERESKQWVVSCESFMWTNILIPLARLLSRSNETQKFFQSQWSRNDAKPGSRSPKPLDKNVWYLNLVFCCCHVLQPPQLLPLSSQPSQDSTFLVSKKH